MNLVPFNHKAHENYNDTCRVCHHADLNACVQCHTLQGTKESNQITLEESMHRLNLNMSCRGCHDLNQRDPKCAGCHAGIARTRQQDPNACQACHMADATRVAESLQYTEEKVLAAMLLDSRNPGTDTFAESDIPENVEVKTLVSQYGPVKMPHRKIVKTLSGNINDNGLVRYFHRDKNEIKTRSVRVAIIIARWPKSRPVVPAAMVGPLMNGTRSSRDSWRLTIASAWNATRRWALKNRWQPIVLPVIRKKASF
jgi:hypothetical protein